MDMLGSIILFNSHHLHRVENLQETINQSIFIDIMLLKEITFHYVPKGQTLDQALWDYYAMSALYRSEGSAGHGAGAQANIRGERRTEIIDNVFSQVVDAVARLYFEKVKNEPRKYAPEPAAKDIKRLENAWRYKDWMEFHAALDSIVKLVKPVAGFERIKKAEMNPKAAVNHLSPTIAKLVQGSSSFDKAEPIPDTPEEEPSAIPIPPAPQKRIIVPPLSQEPPPLDMSMGEKKPKRLDIGTEQFLNNYGFAWKEKAQAYWHPEKQIAIYTLPDNSAIVKYPDGRQKTITNLGLLIRRLGYGHGKTDPVPSAASMPNEPVPSVAESLHESDLSRPKKFKVLWDFLYA